MCIIVASLVRRRLTEVVAMRANATRARIHAPIPDHHVCVNTTVNQNLAVNTKLNIEQLS